MINALGRSQPNLIAALQNWATGKEAMTSNTQAQLAEGLLADRRYATAFNITPETVANEVKERSRLLQEIYPKLKEFCQQKLGWQDEAFLIEMGWFLWIPLATQLAIAQQQLDRPLIQGILGGQGTGKTTLAAILTFILNHLGYAVCSLSLDDLYKTYADRLHLQQFDPRLRWRGPPGTHDVDLGITVLTQLKQAHYPVQLPRFDKSAHHGAGDRTQPETVTHADIVLFEGWFVGARPIDPAQFATAPPPIVTEADQTFARDINARLQDYLPLWNLLDRLMILYPTDYRLSQQWRQHAEQQMIASGRSGMSNAEIHEFVEYFWRSLHPDLFITPLLHNPNDADLAIEIDSNHQPVAIFKPGNSSFS